MLSKIAKAAGAIKTVLGAPLYGFAIQIENLAEPGKELHLERKDLLTPPRMDALLSEKCWPSASEGGFYISEGGVTPQYSDEPDMVIQYNEVETIGYEVKLLKAFTGGYTIWSMKNRSTNDIYHIYIGAHALFAHDNLDRFACLIKKANGKSVFENFNAGFSSVFSPELGCAFRKYYTHDPNKLTNMWVITAPGFDYEIAVTVGRVGPKRYYRCVLRNPQ
jgi:hypothetical protein